MNHSSKPLAFCLTLIFAGPITVPLQAGDGMRISDRSSQRGAVVTGPAVPLVMSGDGESVGPQESVRHKESVRPECVDEPSGVQSHSRWRESPHGSAPFPVGPPFGASSRALFGAQVANGQAARLVLYQYDFLPGRATLAPAGRRKLQQLFPLLVQSPFPLIIEPAGNMPNLDRARRQKVIEHVANLPYPIPPERVIVAFPPTRGISGTEGLGLHLKFTESMIGGGVTTDAAAVPLPY